ncbi:hypothetical protein FVE85_1184 [Porphyridium purpureum]|uniref:Uncharacterized protein n=1 Tax=Porphyridium purpureum TaxID=35688 RepID=A0A5J4Z2D0_PORPP|nr:hypothetical protein FVE85_1184 [Porphyridium purpureum]|eukprot:POR1046..scf208_2
MVKHTLWYMDKMCLVPRSRDVRGRKRRAHWTCDVDGAGVRSLVWLSRKPIVRGCVRGSKWNVGRHAALRAGPENSIVHRFRRGAEEHAHLRSPARSSWKAFVGERCSLAPVVPMCLALVRELSRERIAKLDQCVRGIALRAGAGPGRRVTEWTWSHSFKDSTTRQDTACRHVFIPALSVVLRRIRLLLASASP